MKIKTISKLLSPNDIGLTGAHQAGIHVPRILEILSFFPPLNSKEKNPRSLITFNDDNDDSWQFCFIYYNNRFFGGTRNEYRLTRMTKYIRINNLKVGDEILLTNEENESARVSFKRQSKNISNFSTLKLSGEWKVIRL